MIEELIVNSLELYSGSRVGLQKLEKKTISEISIEDIRRVLADLTALKEDVSAVNEYYKKITGSDDPYFLLMLDSGRGFNNALVEVMQACRFYDESQYEVDEKGRRHYEDLTKGHIRNAVGFMNGCETALAGFLERVRIVKALLSTNVIYEGFPLHPRIREVSESLFRSGHYSQAIFEAFKRVELMVKERSGIRDKYGQNLMVHVFAEDKPVLCLSSDKDEQAGFRFLFMGAMRGVKDPKSHNIVEQKDPRRTLEYLSLASLLAKRVDEATLATK